MRTLPAIVVLCLAWLAPTSAVDRSWKSGTWGPRGQDGSYAVDTASDTLRAEATGDAAATTLDAADGTDVRFAVDGRTLYVLDAAGHEHALTLLRTSPKYVTSYPALGGGHYITAVAAGGRRITLEDGTRWDIDPRLQFSVVGWQADDLIGIRRSTDDPAFTFEVDNTSKDEGVLANLRAR
jgi:hypothetical protein